MATMPHHREFPRPDWAWLPVTIVWAGFIVLVLVVENRWPVRLTIVTIGVAVEVLAARSRRSRPAGISRTSANQTER